MVLVVWSMFMVMVGDGINDVFAFARVDVGIVMGIGMDVVMYSAQVILVKGDLCGIVVACGIFARTVVNMC